MSRGGGMADAKVSKTFDPKDHVGSTPSLGTNMNKFLKILLETLPIFLGIVLSFLFWQNNILLFIIYLTLTLILIYLHKDKSELIIFGYGTLIGIIVEVVGTKISGYQSFTKPDLFGIPLWLPIAWGYGFVAMKRIGLTLKDLGK